MSTETDRSAGVRGIQRSSVDLAEVHKKIRTNGVLGTEFISQDLRESG